jgi:hypothetical protein
MKLTPHLPQLPSIGELLEHPRVRGIAGRINRTTIAKRAAGFIEEMRASFSERAGHVDVPSLSHLADRLVRRLLGDATVGIATINATGVVVGDPAWAPPLADAAMQAMMQAASEYHARHALLGSIERELCRHADSEGALALASLSGAVDLCRAAITSTPCRLEVEPLAGILNPSVYGYQSIDSLGQRIAAGADVVIADGAGLIGGPLCGIVVGRRWVIEVMAEHDRAASLAIDPLQAAALRTTLDAYSEEQADAAMFHTPVWQLLTAPLENLKQRAERLAPLAAHSVGVAAAEAREIESAWAIRGAEPLQAKSWAVVVTPAEGGPEAMAHQLLHSPLPIAAVAADDAVIFDLRAVFPRWDQQLIAALDSLGS